ncbi:N-6 DNA methylase [uncultured Veillonella sp.]|uniref:Eco57I restriction-modification methylase domain-containing protein n=1 Tax=uncultured Veillonella sp. TaxID=159268 RepID=UPI0025E13163|nr:N-6 DNA methylase [uncultured Veillonella sp.]
MRYINESKEKSNGVVYTPTKMADYLAEQMILFSSFNFSTSNSVKILDPAVGEGELLISMIKKINSHSPQMQIDVTGYETDINVANKTQNYIENLFPDVKVKILPVDFLNHIDDIKDKFDFIIANPPYIRTQILGASKAREIAQKTGLTGRIDIYYAFLFYMNQVLSKNGISGYITSNKFLTIKSGTSVRDYIIDNYKIHTIVDFGDTKLFKASVLPCIIVFSKGKTTNKRNVNFTTIYESNNEVKSATKATSIFDCIYNEGLYILPNGKFFNIKKGFLKDIKKGALWVISSPQNEKWLQMVERNTHMYFSDIGKIRVGIKTTADNVFIGENWSGELAKLELLKPLITHRDAGQIISKKTSGWKVLYTHTIKNQKKMAINIDNYPRSKAYLEKHYSQLSARKYIQKANRNWYEIWVPQNPESWKKTKIIFKDISKQPEFWLDKTGAIVNGDCYWIDINDSISEDLIYLALAVANSTFIEKYYDIKFNTKLYSGKRRYMSQYVEQFPIPNPTTPKALEAIHYVKKIIVESDDNNQLYYRKKLDKIISKIFET